MSIQKFETFNFNNKMLEMSGGFMASGHFSHKRDQAKCLEGKKTVWLLTDTATAAQKATAKIGGIFIVENVAQEFIDGIQDTINEYERIAPKLGGQCKNAMVFTRKRATLTPSHST